MEYAIVAFFICMSIFLEIKIRKWEKEKIQFLLKLSGFVEHIRRSYLENGKIGENMIEAGIHCGKEFIYLADRMVDLLNAEKENPDLDDYFINSLYTQCKNLAEFGDTYGEKGSLFADNMLELSKDIKSRILDIRSYSIMFAGVDIVIILPMLFFYPLKKWCISFLPESVFYFEKYGKAVVILCLLVSLSLYFLNKMISPFRREYLLLMLEGAAAKLDIERKRKGMAFFIRNLAVRLLKKAINIVNMLGAGKNEIEIMEYYQILTSLKGVNGMTVFTMLKTMADNSKALKKEMRVLLNDYMLLGNEAFSQSRPHIKNEMFNKLMDSFAACDYSGIEDAFSDLDNEKEFFRLQGNLEKESSIKNGASLMKLLGFLPVIMVFFLYLILPFLVTCLERYGAMMNI
ncbi:MAG: hypothetical protein MJ113_02245 [Lachnospiraceae bacterium]|nr:hypothetical protein [Lachnospiraceae bacterium]